jgi:hypothetical protein
VSQVGEFIAETRDVVDGLGVVVGRFGEVHALAEGEIAIVHANHAVEVSVVDSVVRTWNPIFIIRHFLRVHLESSIGAEFAFICSWNLSN